MMEHLLGCGCEGFYFANGTAIPPPTEIAGYEIIPWKNPYTNETIYVNASYHLIAYARVNYWWYDPNTTSLHINLTGIYLRKDYEFKVNVTVNGTIQTYELYIEGNATIIPGYGEFVSYISTEFPHPKRMYQIFENGTVYDLNFTCVKGKDPQGRDAWIVRTLIHFSNPVVVIQGEYKTPQSFITVLLQNWWLVALIIVMIAVPAVLLIMKKHR